MKQIHWIIIILIIIAVVAILILSGAKFFKVDKYIAIDCETCNNDLKNFNDCKENLELKKNDPKVLDVANKLGVKLDNISKILKKISYPDNVISCVYYG